MRRRSSTTSRLSLFVLILMLLGGAAQAAMRPVTQSDQPAVAVTARSEPRKPLTLDFYLGSSILKGEAGVSLGLRYPLRDPWAVELGGVLPHSVSGYAENSSATSNPPASESVSVYVESFGEVHTLLLYRLTHSRTLEARGQHLCLDAGVGLSLGILTNRAVQEITYGPGSSQTYTPKDHAVAPGPRAQLGLRYAPTQHLSLRLDAAYVYYVNHSTLSGHEYNLSFGGLLIQPALAWVF